MIKRNERREKEKRNRREVLQFLSKKVFLKKLMTTKVPRRRRLKKRISHRCEDKPIM
jgi:hypothetical protein